MRFRPVLLMLCSVLLVGACGGGSSNGKSGSGSLPSVSGSYGDKPVVTTHGSPPQTLQTKVLHQGNGAAVTKGSLLVADYLGQVWGGKVFDNSYDRGEPAAFPIGIGQVVPGWDKALVGQKGGSRVLLVLPPADGYGKNGNAQAGIKGTDTLIFVVDLVTSYDKTAVGDPQATVQHLPAAAPKVTGAPGQQPTVTVPKGLAQPKKVTSVLLAKGHGTPVKAGLTIVQYEAVTWQNQPVGSTWRNGQPAGVPVREQGQTPVFNSLLGLPIGSRVLLEVPAQAATSQSQATPSVAVVADIVAQPQSAKNSR